MDCARVETLLMFKFHVKKMDVFCSKFSQLFDEFCRLLIEVFPNFQGIFSYRNGRIFTENLGIVDRARVINLLMFKFHVMEVDVFCSKFSQLSDEICRFLIQLLPNFHVLMFNFYVQKVYVFCSKFSQLSDPFGRFFIEKIYMELNGRNI